MPSNAEQKLDFVTTPEIGNFEDHVIRKEPPVPPKFIDFLGTIVDLNKIDKINLCESKIRISFGWYWDSAGYSINLVRVSKENYEYFECSNKEEAEKYFKKLSELLNAEKIEI